jgi:acyl-CoA hydrolase
MVDTTPKNDAAAEGRPVNHSLVRLSQVIMPQQTGPGGVFAHGGDIMKMMDTAAGLVALRHAHSQVVTLRVEGINFLQPVRVGNYVTATARMTYASQSSMEIQVRVTAEDVLREREWEALTAYIIFVAVDKDGKTLKVPPLILEDDEDRRLFESGRIRHDTCRIDDEAKALCALD